jgi:hypothetical protein
MSLVGESRGSNTLRTYVTNVTNPKWAKICFAPFTFTHVSHERKGTLKILKDSANIVTQAMTELERGRTPSLKPRENVTIPRPDKP